MGNANLRYGTDKHGARWLHYHPDFKPASEVKEIGGRWEPAGFWKLPPIMASIESLLRLHGRTQVRASMEVAANFNSPFGFVQKASSEYLERLSPVLLERAYPYQLDAVNYLYSSPHPGSLLALSPGLGKMLTTILAAQSIGARHILVVSSLLLAYNWMHEVEKWTGIKGTIRWKEGPGAEDWCFVNYETQQRYPGFRQHWDVLAVDESITVKNHDTKRWDALHKMADQVGKIWLLSGSPVARHADDLYGQFSLMMPKYFTSYWRFARTYCHVEDTQWGSKVVSSKSTLDLQKEFRDVMFVRNQKDVLPDLPKTLHQTVNVALEGIQLRLYNQMKKEMMIQLEGEELKATAKIALIIRLQQIVSNPCNLGPEWPNVSVKLASLCEHIEMNQIVFPALIWTHWTAGAVAIKERLSEMNLKVGLITGKTDQKLRDGISTTYIGNHLDALVISLGTGKHGLTYTNTRSIIRFDKTFDGDAHVQSAARVERIGLTHVPVEYNFKCPGTTDDLVERNLRQKAFSMAQVSNADLHAMLAGLDPEGF